MKVRFYIEKRRGDNGELLTRQRPIFMTVAFHGKRVMITTGKNVDLQWWDHEKQRVRDEHPDAFVINNWLDDYKKCADTVWSVLAQESEHLGADEFRREFNNVKPRFSGGFFDVFFLFMEDGSSRWTAATYQKLRSFYKLLKSFEQESGFRVSFKNVDEKFLVSLTNYEKRLGYNSVTIGKSVNQLVWFLNWATAKGYNIYTAYKGFYKLLERDDYIRKPVHYLEWEELMSLYELTLTDTREDRVRDLFCLMCFSGMNFSELARLRKDDIDAERIMVRGGARKPRFIPLNKYSKCVFEKYANRYYKDNGALPRVSVVTMNKYLKALGERAKLNRKVVVSKSPSQKLQTENIQEVRLALYKTMRVGIATTTFIANAIMLDVPGELIATYTGVKKDVRTRLLKQELSKREMLKFDKI